MKRTLTRSAGFTLVELTIAFTVLAAVLGAIGATVLTGKATYDQGMSIATLEAQARRTLDRIASEFAGAQRSSLNPNPVPAFGSSTLDFRVCTGFAGGAQQWTTTNSIRLRADPADPNDGLDNNSNGLVDECQIVLIRDVLGADPQTTVLSGHVREFLQGESVAGVDQNGNGLLGERGLSFSIVGDTLTIRLTLEALDEERRVITRSVETAVHVRN